MCFSNYVRLGRVQRKLRHELIHRPQGLRRSSVQQTRDLECNGRGECGCRSLASPRGAHTTPWDARAISVYNAMAYEALARGHVDVLDLLQNNGFKAEIGDREWAGWRDISGDLGAIARAGGTDTLHWFGVHCGVKGGDDVTGVLCAEAAGAGEFEMLKSLKSRGYRL